MQEHSECHLRDPISVNMDLQVLSKVSVSTLCHTLLKVGILLHTDGFVNKKWLAVKVSENINIGKVFYGKKSWNECVKKYCKAK